jgi:hypothetical protein
LSKWSAEETNDLLIADHHNFYKVEKWTKEREMKSRASTGNWL